MNRNGAATGEPSVVAFGKKDRSWNPAIELDRFGEEFRRRIEVNTPNRRRISRCGR
jgi:hypothetical protein